MTSIPILNHVKKLPNSNKWCEIPINKQNNESDSIQESSFSLPLGSSPPPTFSPISEASSHQEVENLLDEIFKDDEFWSDEENGQRWTSDDLETCVEVETCVDVERQNRWNEHVKEIEEINSLLMKADEKKKDVVRFIDTLTSRKRQLNILFENMNTKIDLQKKLKF